VDSVVRSCSYQLRQLRSIRRSLTFDAAYTLAHAFIHSRVDYCNAILVVVSDGVIRKLQSVLHAAARLVTGVRWNEHITPTLRDTLHWLPVYGIGSHTTLQRWHSDVFVVRVRHTSLTCVFQLRLLLDALLVTVNLSCRRRGLRHLAVAVSALLPPPFGTVFHIISAKVTLVEDNSLVV